jgi:dolichol-phosphate mannosyltransferase
MIELVLAQAANLDVLVVDDNSPDGTAAIVAEIGKTNPRVQLMRRTGKLGLGTAYIAGFKWGLSRGYGCLVQMDADFSHDPREIPNMQKAIEHADLVLGSRYIDGVRVVNWPLSRLFLSKGASYYVRIITGLPVYDPTGGFKCLRRSVLEALDLDAIRSNGYAFQIEITYEAWMKGFRVQEIPITFRRPVRRPIQNVGTNCSGSFVDGLGHGGQTRISTNTTGFAQARWLSSNRLFVGRDACLALSEVEGLLVGSDRRADRAVPVAAVYDRRNPTLQINFDERLACPERSRRV